MYQQKIIKKLKSFNFEVLEETSEYERKTEINILESTIGSQLPQEYSWFLRTYGASCFGIDVVLNSVNPSPWAENGTDTIDTIDFFLGFSPSNFSIFTAYSCYRDQLPRQKLLPIAESPGGNLICLSLEQKDYGSIYFWDHESDNYEKSLYFSARSFVDFIDAIKKENRIYTDEEIDSIHLELDDDL